jgi:plasmid stabilization system protein ParE
MTLRVVFRRAAKREFEHAAVWYDEQRSGLGEEFVAEVEQAVANAAAAPQRYPVVFDDIRRTIARRFLGEAARADVAMQESGVGYAMQDVHNCVAAKARGKPAKRPSPVKWRK